MCGQYYLHENGKLIFKPHGGVEFDSTFVKGVWSEEDIGESPFAFLKFLMDAKENGALNSEILRLHDFNKLDEYIEDSKQQLNI